MNLSVHAAAERLYLQQAPTEMAFSWVSAAANELGGKGRAARMILI